METNPENKIYSAGYAETFHGKDDFSSEFSSYYEKEPDGTVGASNLYVLASGTQGTSFPEVSARFAVKKLVYHFFHSDETVDAQKLAKAMRAVNNEIYEYAKVQSDTMSASAIALAVTDGQASIVTIGGCRAFIIRNGKVYQITEDPVSAEEEASEEAYASDGELNAPVNTLGTVRDITSDVYDGIEVHEGDVLLLCSASLDTFISKKEILEAVDGNSPRSIVQNLLSLPSLQNAAVPASVAAVRIYDSETVDTMIRVDGASPADTDVNLEKKEIELIRKHRPRGDDDPGTEKKKIRWGRIIPGILIALLLLAGGVWAAARYGLIPDEIREKYLGNLVPSTPTMTPTIDWVRESMTVYELTAEAEKAAAVAATVEAWPTQTPYPTYTPVFIDLEDTPAAKPTERPAVSDADTGTGETEPPADDNNEPAAPTATPEPEEETPEPVVKENYTDEKSGAEMLYVPAGRFLLGSDMTKDLYAAENADEETPQVRIALDGFWMNKTEVTNAQYLKCVEVGVCEQNYYMSIYAPELENNPVSYVTFEQAERFCSWIGGHVPSEYEWEKAARGTDGRVYPWGDEEPTLDNDLANVPMYVDADGNGNDLFPVGTFPKGVSPYGMLDMAGNVWEWTSTWYSLNYYQTLAAEEEISGTVVSNPTGPENGSARVIRGGSCASTEVNNFESFMRAANRSYLAVTSSYYLGFRCVVRDSAETEAPEMNGPRPEGPDMMGPRP